MELLTVSRMRAHHECKRKEYLLYGEGIRPVRDTEALRIGTLVHIGLEAWLIAMVGDPANSDSWYWAAIDAVKGQAIDDYEQVRVEEMLHGYHFRWCHEPFDVVATEQQFTAPLLNPSTSGKSRTFQSAGKIDGLVRVDGRLHILEHKTTSDEMADPTSPYWAKLDMDAQVSMYYLGATALGHEVEGCLYDVVRKPMFRPKLATPPEKRKFTKAGTLYKGQREDDELPEEYRARLREEIAKEPERYYQRRPVHRLDSQLLEFMHDAWVTGNSIRELHNAARDSGFQAVPRNSDACHRWGSPCPFWDCCSAGLDPDEHPDRFQRIANKHPELDPEPATEGDSK